MCTCVHISVTKWCIVGYWSGALWDLWNVSLLGLITSMAGKTFPAFPWHAQRVIFRIWHTFEFRVWLWFSSILRPPMCWWLLWQVIHRRNDAPDRPFRNTGSTPLAFIYNTGIFDDHSSTYSYIIYTCSKHLRHRGRDRVAAMLPTTFYFKDIFPAWRLLFFILKSA